MGTLPPRPSSLLNELQKYRNLVAAQVDAIDDLIDAVQSELGTTRALLDRTAIPQRMSLHGAARYLRIGRTTLRKLIANGQIAAFDAGDGSNHTILIKSDLDAYLRALPEKRLATPEQGSRAGDEPSK